MKIYQLVTTLGYGDAVGNHIVALKSLINELGYLTDIYAENIDSRLSQIGKVLPSDFRSEKEDIIIYHLATATDLNYKLRKYKGRKILIYHNITPPEFFTPYDKQAEKNCSLGLSQTKLLADQFDYCMPVSEFNKQDLIHMGYSCPMDVVPILIKFEDYLTPPSGEIVKQYQDGITNIVFLGRIAPNKKQEDVILSFYHYKKYYNPKARLFLVGSYRGLELYYNRLLHLCHKLGLEDVYFTGHISFDKMLAYYQIADVFLCMSEHEGFCVPLVESMYFNVPIIAYDSTAIKETLGGSGVLLREKNYLEIAGMINRLVSDSHFKENILMKERKRLEDFSPELIKMKIATLLQNFIKQ